MLGISLDRGLRREGGMGRQRYTPEQIIGKLREVEVALAKGRTVVEVARTLDLPPGVVPPSMLVMHPMTCPSNLGQLEV